MERSVAQSASSERPETLRIKELAAESGGTKLCGLLGPLEKLEGG